MSGTRSQPFGLDITSVANPRVKHLVALRRRRVRDAERVTLVEGFEELDLALSCGVRPLTLWHCPELGAGTAELADRAAGLGAEVVRVSQDVFRKIAYRESPDGWLAVVPAVGASLAELAVPADPLILVCQGVEKPGNLGAILRTADAAGVAAVLATDPVTDWGNPNVIRASKGTIFSVPVASANSDEALSWLAEHDVGIVAATPSARVLLHQADLTGPRAIAVGAEKHGLSDQWLDQAAIRVRIPMFGRADSLNVATSAAVICYEAVRQRLVRTP